MKWKSKAVHRFCFSAPTAVTTLCRLLLLSKKLVSETWLCNEQIADDSLTHEAIYVWAKASSLFWKVETECTIEKHFNKKNKRNFCPFTIFCRYATQWWSYIYIYIKTCSLFFSYTIFFVFSYMKLETSSHLFFYIPNFFFSI